MYSSTSGRCQMVLAVRRQIDSRSVSHTFQTEYGSSPLNSYYKKRTVTLVAWTGPALRLEPYDYIMFM